MGLVKAYAGGSNAVLKDWSFAGATPTSFVDKSGSGNHGTFTDITMAQLASGLWTYQFNGTTSYINVSDTLGLDITARPLTIAAWIKPAADAGDGYIFCRNVDAVANIQYALGRIATTSTLRGYLEGASCVDGTSSSVPVSVWTLCGMVWASNGVSSAYVNGVVNNTAAAITSALTSRANISIGRRATAAYFKGDAALMRVLPVEWTAADWLKVYNFERKFFSV